jgi:RNA polymerase sigma-70 factor, ECF subfamily
MGGAVESFESLRPTLFSLAYRMLGSVSEAEDIVQEAFLRQQRALSQGAEIDSPKAFLSAVVTRLSIDHLRSARARREVYVGEWLPEPLLTDVDPELDPADHAEQADSLSLAFLVLLEQLTPVERAVFLLHDVFGYGYDEIVETVGKSAENCRQLAARARRHIEEQKPRFEASREQRDRLAARFFAAVQDGDIEALVELLAADVVVYGDSGGRAPSWPRPIVGRDRVSRLFAGIGRQLTAMHVTLRLHEVNGQPGAVMLDAEERIINVFSLDIADGVVQTIRSVINPDKLRHLGPLADVRALLSQQREPATSAASSGFTATSPTAQE